MVSGRDSPNLSAVVSGLHLIFTLASVVFLSYKVYNLENELSLIRREVPTQKARKSSNVGIDVNATPLTKFQGIEDQEHRSRRNHRAGKRKSKSSTSDKLKTVCVQKLLSNLQVCCVPLFFMAKENPNRQLWSGNNVIIELVTKPITHLRIESSSLFLDCTLTITR